MSWAAKFSNINVNFNTPAFKPCFKKTWISFNQPTLTSSYSQKGCYTVYRSCITRLVLSDCRDQMDWGKLWPISAHMFEVKSPYLPTLSLFSHMVSLVRFFRSISYLPSQCFLHSLWHSSVISNPHDRWCPVHYSQKISWILILKWQVWSQRCARSKMSLNWKPYHKCIK